MRTRDLLLEAVRVTWSSKVSTALIMVMAASMCFVGIVTVGKTAAAEAAVQERLDSAGARQLMVRDTMASGFINHRTLEAVASMDTVDRAVALGSVFDGRSGAIGDGAPPVTVWPVHGDLTQVAHMVRGRMPQPGEVIISEAAQEAMGMEEPVGFVVAGDKSYPVVGSYASVPPFDDFDAGILLAAERLAPARELRVVIDSIEMVPITQRTTLEILDPPPDTVLVESPASLAETARDIGGELAGFNRSLMLLILGAGAIFIAAVVLSDVLIRRRDLGRRRTLGISRFDLTWLVTVRMALPAVLGTVIGVGAANAVTAIQAQPVPLPFSIGVSILSVLTAAVAALGPAVFASYRDPVQVMRTP